MNQSETIADLAAALIEAKKKFLPALKTATNPAFKSKYTDLATAIAATENALLEQGIVAIQSPSSNIANKSVIVYTRLLHKSGEFMEGDLEMPATGRQGYDAQSVGSAITYARRYSLMAMLGIAPEDDDGNAASGGHEEKPGIQRKSEKTQVGITESGEPLFDENGEVVEMAAPPVAKKPATNGYSKPINNGAPSKFANITEKQAKRFFAVAMSAGHTKTDINHYLSGIGCERSDDIPPAQYEAAMQWAATR